MPSLLLDDFSGGITDQFLGGPTNKFEEADNIIIVDHGPKRKPRSRFGSEIYNSTYYQIPAGAQRIGTLKYFRPFSKMLFHSARDFYYINSGWQTLQGPTGNKIFPAGTTVDNVVSIGDADKQLFIANDAYTAPSKIYVDGSNNLQLRTAGLPRLASSPTVTAGAAGAGSYLYRFIYYYSYAVGTVTYEDRGASTEVSLVNAAAPNINPVAITLIPVLANGATTNYDTTVIKVEIYRTINGGVDFFKVGEVTNGTTTFNDNMSDATLLNQLPLYTNGGIVENETPPLCKVVHVTQDTAAYGNIKEGTEIRANRFRVSVPGDHDACPEDFYVDLEDDIVAISSFRGFWIALCEKTAYRIEGGFDLFGRGGLVRTKIGDVSGCISSQSAVQTLEGVFWAGPNGFYYTDGYNVLRISEEWETRYLAFSETAAQKRRIVGKYDSTERRVSWTVQEDNGVNSDCSKLYVLHIKYGIKPDSCFTTWSGGSINPTNFAPTALEYEGENLVRGDTRGYAFKHLSTLYNDPKIDTLTAPSTWHSSTILFDFKTCALDFDNTQTRKLGTRVVVTCRNETNLSLQVTSINDESRNISDLKLIRFTYNLTWGDPDFVWGDPAFIWNYGGLIEEQRRFPATSLRFSYKQLQLTNAKSVIRNSDLLGPVDVDATLKTATLVNAATSDMPSGAVDYYIAFSNDYTKEFLITSRSANTVVFEDSSNFAPQGQYDFEIRGYPKGQALYLLGLNISYENFGLTQNSYTKSEGGGVGA